MQEKDKKTWAEGETWAVSVIEDARINAKRWFVAWLITLFALIGTNAAWIYVFQSYEYISQDGSGNNNINTGNQENVQNGPEDEN